MEVGQLICLQNNIMINQKNIFYSNGKWFTRADLLKSLISVEADECDVLYVHSSFSFGIPNPSLTRSEIIHEFYSALIELKVRTVCMPTFTFSFCNGKNYDNENSKSSMGALNEYFRKQPAAIRSCDPLMSSAIIGKDKDLVLDFSGESVGKDSTFDRISKKNNVRFLFMGTGLPDCFTYMHYLEWVAKAPYRYNRVFNGDVNCHGKKQKKEATLFVRYNNVMPNIINTVLYGEKLKNIGATKEIKFGDSFISCVEKDIASEVYLDIFSRDPNYFICDEFSKEEADSSFYSNNMVAL
jgi:aminoglycoside 3-N-acetyltransferase